MDNHSKADLRQHYQKMREQLSSLYQQKASLQICTRIQTLLQYDSAKHIALYRAIRGEVNLDELWKVADLQEKNCYFPIVNSDKTLSFLPATRKTGFIKNRYGILEPDVEHEKAIPIHQLDIVLIPVVAFDKHGTRIGMGAGCYDRTLTNKKNGLLLGVAYEVQKETYIAPSEWDVPLHAVVTPDTVYWRP